jgi:hypothetical protein
MPPPFASAGPSVGPAPTGGHLEEIVVPDPMPPSRYKTKKNKQNQKFKLYIAAISNKCSNR